LRTWLLVRLGLWRGTWRRGRVDVRGVQMLTGPFAVHSWRYGLYCPAGLRDDDEAPLLVVLHGCKQRALGFAVASGWTRYADLRRVRLLCPDQRRFANLYRCWNWFAPRAQRGDGEQRVVLAMLDAVAAQVALRPGAVAMVGLSAGGALAALLAFHHPQRFRAVVAVAAMPLLGASNVLDPHDVMKRGLAFGALLGLGGGMNTCAPLAVIHGADDDVVHPRCAEQLVAQAVEANRRDDGPLTAGDASTEPGVAAVDYRRGGELRVRAIRVDGLGHEWSGGPGGHPYCEGQAASLTALCAQFLGTTRAFGSRAVAAPQPALA
jgi:poly(hydroxyalkanoate) depolymerase family esterase